MGEGALRQNLILWGRMSREDPPLSRGDDHFSRVADALHDHESLPDLECLSWTHDADFEQHAPLPAVALRAREKRRHMEELMALAARATDAHIAALPPNHRPLVRMLRSMAAPSKVDVNDTGG